MKVLVTGGAGFIGSHTVVELEKAGHQAAILDNLTNSSQEVVKRISALVDREIPLFETDMLDTEALNEIFNNNQFDAVIHMAGLKSVAESVEEPKRYNDVNVGSTMALLDAMKNHRVDQLIFSSSATVYGEPETLPVNEEDSAINATNPYGMTKVINERILQDTAAGDDSWEITILRYSNPIGAHPSGTIGEAPHGKPNNIMPVLTQVAVGKLKEFELMGTDYETNDGTTVRDYLHVIDVARAHVEALKHIESGCQIYNVSTGVGTSAKQLIKAFEKANDLKIPVVDKPRRDGDVAEFYLDASKAEQELGWKAEISIEQACRDAWNWQQKNPQGYQS
jgi:UDP-glucose 4-epimerase